MPDAPDCPLCKAPPSYIEAFAGTPRTYFCNGCGRWFALDAQGRAVRSGPTQHERPALKTR